MQDTIFLGPPALFWGRQAALQEWQNHPWIISLVEILHKIKYIFFLCGPRKYISKKEYGVNARKTQSTSFRGCALYNFLLSYCRYGSSLGFRGARNNFFKKQCLAFLSFKMIVDKIKRTLFYPQKTGRQYFEPVKYQAQNIVPSCLTQCIHTSPC